ncbi:MAG: RNA polymerase sigma factor (sigma-70 family) [Limisphaerales bacterium]|jgi:RNA polymerase sigma factor (sigma-70 family)
MDIVRHMDEARMVTACVSQDRKAQEFLYKKFYGKMMGLSLRYARDRDEAAEILNKGFFKVFKSLGQYDNKKGKLEAWIYRIVMHSAIDHYRTRIKPERKSTIEDLSAKDSQYKSESALDRLSAEEILALVHQLSPAYRTVFNMYVLDGFNHREIGEQLGISEGTSKSNLSKARKNLQKMLAKREEAENRIDQSLHGTRLAR